MAWEKWNLEDEGRAELPVHGTDDTFPCGMCLDLTSTVPIPYGGCGLCVVGVARFVTFKYRREQ